MKKKVLIMLVIFIAVTPLLSISVSANPFQHVDIKSNMGKVSNNELVKTGNLFLTIVYVLAGIIITILFIVGCVLLATSGTSAGRRNSGFIALGFSLLAGYFLYKAGALDTIFKSITGG